MASRGIDEYAGTGADDGTGIGGGPVDPASLLGGIAGGTADDGPDSDYQRNPDGSFKLNRDGSKRRKPGRKGGGSSGGDSGNPSRSAGSGSKSSKSKDDLKRSIDNLSGILVMGHTMLAGIANTPELEIEKGEGEILANGIVPVLDLYDFEPSKHVTAWLGLGMALGQVYGPRAYLIRARVAEEAKARKDADMKNVTPGFVA